MLFLITFSGSLPWFTVLGPSALLHFSGRLTMFQGHLLFPQNGRTIFPSQLHVKTAHIFSVAIASLFHLQPFIIHLYAPFFLPPYFVEAQQTSFTPNRWFTPNSRHDTFRGCPPPFVLDGWFRAAWLLGLPVVVHLQLPLLLWNTHTHTRTKADSNPSKTCGTHDGFEGKNRVLSNHNF